MKHETVTNTYKPELAEQSEQNEQQSENATLRRQLAEVAFALEELGDAEHIRTVEVAVTQEESLPQRIPVSVGASPEREAS